MIGCVSVRGGRRFRNPQVTLSESDDVSDDLVAEDDGHRLLPPPGHRVQVRAADGAHPHAAQRRAGLQARRDLEPVEGEGLAHLGDHA